MNEIWSKAKTTIQEQLSSHVYDMWIRPLKQGRTLAEDHLEILASNDFSADYIQSHFGSMLESSLSSEAGRPIRISYRADPNPDEVAPEEKSKDSSGSDAGSPATTARIAPTPVEPVESIGLDPRYTFDSFVVGGCNQFAHAAAARVAEAPAAAYNPLFIHGGVGLGKTHILHAIGNELAKTRPELKVLYISSEKFMTQLINSLRFNRVFDFKENFRTVDILLVDDIQFIAGKKATQEEFFHTFNALFEANKQIILSSDSFPADIEHLEERLRSRFGWGLVADILTPDLETRVAILKKKAATEGVEISDDVAFYLADAIQTNVRELEGGLIRLSALASLTQKPINLPLVKESMRGLFKSQDKQVSIENIQKTVSAYYKIRPSDIRSGKRSRLFSHPRQVAMYLCKQLTRHSYPEIGHQFGKKDHTTVLYAVRQIEKKKGKDPTLAEELESLVEMLRK
ncbi:MAG: chromosomal replication initiator protein DnaA [Magnetococcales bacterium]|nr:chromosomal replication initiator protein DnaA [Magnetococcales bacterium]